jgi:hypothetical protein
MHRTMIGTYCPLLHAQKKDRLAAVSPKFDYLFDQASILEEAPDDFPISKAS